MAAYGVGDDVLHTVSIYSNRRPFYERKFIKNSRVVVKHEII